MALVTAVLTGVHTHSSPIDACVRAVHFQVVQELRHNLKLKNALRSTRTVWNFLLFRNVFGRDPERRTTPTVS
uniref:Uncharacterized protein n=1 Tax=Anguilla anguilla TaxID=7936 RepID=A0A0E9XEH1_ANGAN